MMMKQQETLWNSIKQLSQKYWRNTWRVLYEVLRFRVAFHKLIPASEPVLSNRSASAKQDLNSLFLAQLELEKRNVPGLELELEKV